jgi:prepilin-type N-terminal cleavage/methylation domain-containing protein
MSHRPSSVAPAGDPAPSCAGRPGAAEAAFSLIELLVVIAIIALLATIGLPALRGIGKSNRLNAATRQILDDLALARLRAINSRTTVYMVIVPTNVAERLAGETDTRARRQLTNLLTAPYTTYALLTKRTVGDQPGRDIPQYITDWKRLPDGILFPHYKFIADPRASAHPATPGRPWYEVLEYAAGFDYLTNAVGRNSVPFPIAGSYDPNAPLLRLPVLGFDSMGQLLPNVDGVREDRIIPLAEGSIFFKPDQNGRLSVPDLEIKPPKNWTNNFIRVSWLTGRAVLERRNL